MTYYFGSEETAADSQDVIHLYGADSVESLYGADSAMMQTPSGQQVENLLKVANRLYGAESVTSVVKTPSGRQQVEDLWKGYLGYFLSVLMFLLAVRLSYGIQITTFISMEYLLAKIRLRGLSTVTVDDFPASLSSISDWAFCDCRSLASIAIPDSVTSIGIGAFDGCTSLASITIPDSVTSIGSGAFDGCASLASITIPDTITTIGDWTFKACRTSRDTIRRRNCDTGKMEVCVRSVEGAVYEKAGPCMVWRAVEENTTE